MRLAYYLECLKLARMQIHMRKTVLLFRDSEVARPMRKAIFYQRNKINAIIAKGDVL